MSNSAIFLVSFLAYTVFMIWLGWYVSRKQKSGEDFLLGGRGFPFFLTLGTTVATMVGTGSSMGAVGFGYRNGWAGALYGLGGAVGILLLAWWFAPLRKKRFMTMSEELSYYVGANKLVQSVAGILMFVASIGWLGAHMLGGGLYLAWIAQIDPSMAKIIVALGFAIYVVIGGYTAVVWTDTIQAIILFFGFIILAYLAVDTIGGLSHIYDSMEPAATSFLGLEKVGIIPGLSLAMVVAVGVLATPSYRQRIYSGASVHTVRRSFVVSGVLYLGFSLIPALVGMAAHTINPDLQNSNFAFPYMAIQVLPLVFGIIVLLAGLSATLSSASSDAVAGVSILMRDIFVLFTGRTPARERVMLYSRLSLVGVIGFALVFALMSDDIISYITKMIATVMSGLFVCSILGRFWHRFNWQGALAALIGASATSTVILFNADWLAYWGNPCIPSVLASLGLAVAVTLLTPKSAVSRDEALQILTTEREGMEAVQA